MAKLPGEGTLLQRGDGAGPEVFTTIAQRVSIDGPDRKVEAVKTTDLDDTAAKYRPSQIPDNGELGLTIHWDPANTGHQGQESLMATPGAAAVNYRLVFNNGSGSRPHRQFAAVQTGFKPGGMEENGNLSADIKLQISGPITSGTTTIP